MKKLSINELKCFRGESLVLNGISAEIKEGESYVIKGSNGSGKTTLLRVLSSLIKNYSGSITYEDRDIKDDYKFYQKFSFIGQKNALKENLSVSKNFKLWEIIFGKKIDVNLLLQKYNLNTLIDKDVGSLSDGQKKCLSLLKLKFSSVPIWYLDEPFVFLDSHNRSILIDEIKSHNHSGGIALITTNTELDYKSDGEIIL
tara:strand:+ start:37 stop:636 length:600 start_codon:yes stop_codon:yes gene_type:complete